VICECPPVGLVCVLEKAAVVENEVAEVREAAEEAVRVFDPDAGSGQVEEGDEWEGRRLTARVQEAGD